MTQPNGSASSAAMQPLAPLNIPRITPPMGERLPLHGLQPQPLPLEPSVVPNPPVTPADVPRTAKAMPGPAPAQVAKPSPPPYTLGDESTFPQSPTASVEQVLWCLARFPRAEVQGTWEGAIGSAKFAEACARFDKETRAYAEALAAWTAAQAAPAPQQAAPVAQVVASPPKAETTTLPHGSTIVYEPPVMPAALQQPGALAIGAKWALHGTPAEIVGFGPAQHNPLDQEVYLRTEAGTGHTTVVKFLANPSTGWAFLQGPAKAAAPQELELDQAAIAAIHYDAPAARSIVAQQAAQAQQAEGTKRRLTSAAKQRCLELLAQGKTNLEIAQATGLPMELVERAVAGAPSPQVQAAAAEKAYQSALVQGASEPAAQAAATQAIEQSIVGGGLGVPSGRSSLGFEHLDTMRRLVGGFNAYLDGIQGQERDETFTMALRTMRQDIGFLLVALGEEGP